ncbi:uncharacterized protein LOC144870207 isoform X2 [Branchiostoma floridae x Branchiostoma japonicum]
MIQKQSACIYETYMAKTKTKLSTVVEEFQELDLIFKSGSDLDVVERGYGRKLIDAIGSQNEVLESEALKSLGDLYLHKARIKQHKAENFKRACGLYKELLRFYKSNDEKEVVQRRIKYAEKCTKLVDDEESFRQRTENPDSTMSAVSATLWEKTKMKGQGMMPLVEAYTKFLVTSIVDRNKRMEVESLKGIGDLYLERGRVCKDEAEFAKSVGFYRAALDRCEDSDGRETLRHRIKYAEKVKENGAKMVKKRDLDRAEKHFAAALKSVHVKDSNSGEHWKEVEPLCKLTDVYLKRGKLSKDGGDFTKAAALCNAALVRARAEDRKDIKQRIQKITQAFVTGVLGIEHTVPFHDVKKHKSVLMANRGFVEEEIKRVEQQADPYCLDDNDPKIRDVEKKRAKEIKALFDTIAHQRRTFISGLVDECMEVMGPPPCKYAMIGLGSQATGLVTPYSDLEFAILIQKETENSVNYFHNLTHYLHLLVINLGETILLAMAIQSLNDFVSGNKLDNWFYDSVTPRGFAFDGAMPHACKTPLGRGKTSHLIRTPRAMAKFLEDDVNLHLKKGYHLASVLGNVSLITGEPHLVEEYTDAWDQQLKESRRNIATQVAKATLKETSQTLERDNITDKMLDVKKDIYRFSSLAVSCWALLFDIQPTSIWDTIQKMHKNRIINDENAHHLMVMVSISAELRLRTYMNNRAQVENMSALPSMSTGNSDIAEKSMKVFYFSNTRQLMRYYYTATPLKDLISNFANFQPPMKPLILFDKSSRLQADVYKSLCDNQKWKTCTERALHEERCKHGQNAINADIADLLNNLGVAYESLGDTRNDVSNHPQSLQMTRTIHGTSVVNADISPSLTNLGLASGELGDHRRKAVRYHEQSLKMMRRIYGKNTAHRKIAGSLSNLGIAWSALGDHRKAAHYHEQALQMMRRIQNESTAHPDTAASLNNLGAVWHTLGDYRKSISYYERSLKMNQSIYGEGTAHPDIARSFNNLGTPWGDLGDHRKAISYYEQALQMMRTIYGERTAHPDIAVSLCTLGNAWKNLGDSRKAISYHEQSLQMTRSIYGEKTAHPNIAFSLNSLGVISMDLGDHRKAVDYYEHALQMVDSVRGEITAHPLIPTILINLGIAWNHLRDYPKAIRYFEESLQMGQNSYGENTAHPDIASSLNNLGRVWGRLGDHKKAVSYAEQSLQMMRRIYGQSTAHPHIAASLATLGNAWRNLGDNRKAISYHEQSLQMRRSIYGEGVARLGIASSLYNLSLAWIRLGDHEKAFRYFEEAEKMKHKMECYRS